MATSFLPDGSIRKNSPKSGNAFSKNCSRQNSVSAYVQRDSESNRLVLVFQFRGATLSVESNVLRERSSPNGLSWFKLICGDEISSGDSSYEALCEVLKEIDDGDNRTYRGCEYDVILSRPSCACVAKLAKKIIVGKDCSDEQKKYASLLRAWFEILFCTSSTDAGSNFDELLRSDEEMEERNKAFFAKKKALDEAKKRRRLDLQ